MTQEVPEGGAAISATRAGHKGFPTNKDNVGLENLQDNPVDVCFVPYASGY